MDGLTGLKRFEARLNGAVVEEIRRWNSHPELGKLLASLDAHTHSRTFFSTYAEAIIARHLLSCGCDLRFEVPTPAGKCCDFEIRCRGQRFFLHVKRADSRRPARRKPTVSSRLRYLERIARPYVVNVRWQEDLTDEQMHHFVTSAAEFVRRSRVGDELAVADDDGRALGGVRIAAPCEGTHVRLEIDPPTGTGDDVPRMQKLMRKAYKQFMPRATNVILIGTTRPDAADDVETALLGSHIERWDALPPRGRRIAHGRASDGLWHDGQLPESMAAGWFCFAPEDDAVQSSLWIRPGASLDPPMKSLLAELFETQ